MKFKRSLRVSELIKREISEIIFFELKDPSIKSVTITFVRMTDDLKHARIYYRVLGDDQAKDRAFNGLERAKNFIRAEVGHRTELRFVPEIQFCYDSSIDNAEHIESLLKKIHNNDRS